MKITEGLKTLEKALEKELTEFFVMLGESEVPEGWPEHASGQEAQPEPRPAPPLHH